MLKGRVMLAHRHLQAVQVEDPLFAQIQALL
jgi:hypothetical protein